MKTDRNSRTCNHRNEIVGVWDLSSVIENRDDEETDEAARESPRNDFRRDDQGTSWASMRVGQMPLAAGTGGHLVVAERTRQ
jgi:hypothetical protein